ncbi:MAG: S4 domain-containing protein [Granulosicoccaceae bacterium]|jgi:ribosome-associated heat shock protein Hsp15
MDSQRLDKWLWAARFYKTRPLAIEAISGGKVHVNGSRVKPSRTVKTGDELTISRGPYTMTVHVEALRAQRGPASVAQQLYRETADSLAAREQLREQLRLERAAQPSSQRRPDKRARRQIIRFTRRKQD